jgi:hypothetical protein
MGRGPSARRPSAHGLGLVNGQPRSIRHQGGTPHVWTLVPTYGSAGGGVTHSSRHDRALPRAVTRLPIELAIVSLEQVSLVQDKADLAQQVKGRWRGGIG